MRLQLVQQGLNAHAEHAAVPQEVAAFQVGLRGLRVGSAHVSEKHANFIQGSEGGSADDVKALMEAVRERVLRERGVLLRSEIRLVGFE
jgi:UDP-N-acetylmuramate dehydrogenase